ncbi:MAG: Rrf2 family transcriptional regulator [Candidatus Caenarcaniphilales bacterium]|nr:Rrf2 family transcriptional regulator [Candidatus Caenarcaniphilales bacterium]
MFKISSQEEFGLRFLVQLAKADEKVTNGQEVSLSEIADREGVSLSYVRKIFGILRSGNLVKASKGVLGGYSLAKPASEINLMEVFEVLKTQQQDFSCNDFSGNLSVCANFSNCGVRPVISLLRRKIDNFLAEINLSQLVKEEISVISELKKNPEVVPLQAPDHSNHNNSVLSDMAVKK